MPKWQPGQSGNPAGRAKSVVKEKEHAEAREWALPLVSEVLGRLDRHMKGCPAKKDCAMCRHYNTMIMEYAYGKPPQRHELVRATAREDVEKLAKKMGLTEDETKAALAEVDRHLEEMRKDRDGT